MSRTAREALWSTAATIILPLRFLATLACVIFIMLWLVTAFRDSLLNVWLWWSIGAVAVMFLSTYGYSWLRVQYPAPKNDDD